MALKNGGSLSLADSLGSLKVSSSIQSQTLNILDFTESPKFLNIKLYPVQRFILKLIYSIPLENNLADPIIIRDQFNEQILFTFYSEQEFLEFLYKEERINSLDFNDPVSTIFLVCGRRASKNTITSIITSYTLYLLFQYDCPQEDLFGIIRVSEISVAICSNSKPNSKKAMREVQKMISNSPFFKDFIVNNSVSHSGSSEGAGLVLVTKSELKTGVKAGNIIVTAFAANPSVRGSNNIVAIMDEFAHFIDSEKSTKDNPLDKELWKALTPSTSGFVDINGKKLGKNIVLTSPNGRRGEVWIRRESSKGSKNTIFLNLPTWWMNPRISSEDLKEEFKASEINYRQEYMAEFTSRSGLAIGSKDKFMSQIDLSIPNTISNRKPTAHYYIGIDQAFSGDAFSVAVSHFETNHQRVHMEEHYTKMVKSSGVIVFDYIGRMIPTGNEKLQVDEVLDWLSQILRTFRIRDGQYDSWSAHLFGYVLNQRGIGKNIRELVPTQASNDQIARTFKSCLADGIIAYPYNEEFIEEMELLTEKTTGKYIKIENTTGHDDMYSAMSKSLNLCYSYHILKKKPNTANVSPSGYSSNFKVELHNKMVLNSVSKFNGIPI